MSIPAIIGILIPLKFLTSLSLQKDPERARFGVFFCT